MHRKYADKGVVAMSVSVDQPEQREAALSFLKKQGAAFPNFWLDEETSVWQTKFDLNGPPVVFVYNRAGKVVDKINGGYEDVEKLVKELIKEPAP
jgi:hypothetical protein